MPPPGLQWLTPYSACTMAEFFSARGRDVLLVIDDLTKHAAVYREVSLLLRRPPGREAYPGDIFYIHSRLLERAAKLSPEKGGGSLTALPIAETQAGNISAFIPTNLISITDGQIYLDPRLFYEDQKPAVDVGKSVSRVGGKTQAPVLKAVSESLRLEYAQFLELEVFTRFGTMVDERTRKTIEHGRRIRAVLAQRQFAPLALGEEVALLVALSEGVLDEIAAREDRRDFRGALRPWLAEHGAGRSASWRSGQAVDGRAARFSEGRASALASQIDSGQNDAPCRNRSQHRQYGRAVGHRRRDALACRHAHAGSRAHATRHPALCLLDRRSDREHGCADGTAPRTGERLQHAGAPWSCVPPSMALSADSTSPCSKR